MQPTSQLLLLMISSRETFTACCSQAQRTTNARMVSQCRQAYVSTFVRPIESTTLQRSTCQEQPVRKYYIHKTPASFAPIHADHLSLMAFPGPLFIVFLPRPSAPVCCSLLPPSVTCGLDCGSPLWSEGDDDTLLYCPPLEAIICLVASLAGPAVLFPSAARAARECRPRRPGRPSHGAPAAAARHCRLQSAGTCSGAAPNPTQPSRRGDTGSPAAAAATDRRVRSRRLPA